MLVSRLGLLLLLVAVLVPASAGAFKWDRIDTGCEPPEIFYSAAHDPLITQSCCNENPERCPGDVACLGTGFCDAPYGSTPCVAPAGTDAPNMMFLLLDDMGWCQYGFMEPECRSQKYGIVLPSPVTPNLDKLALQPDNQGRGRFFTINYSNAGWSLPAREGLQMGLYRKDRLDPNVPDRYMADLLTKTDGPVYCTFAAGGKVGGSTPSTILGFRAENSGRKWGRYPCEAVCDPLTCDTPPVCALDLPDPSLTPENVTDVFKFIESTLLGPRDINGDLIPGTTYTQAQPFLVFLSSSLPHKPFKPPLAIEDRNYVFPDYLFSDSVAFPGTKRFPFAEPAYAEVFDKTVERKMPGVYGNVYWADDAVKQMRDYLESIMVWDHTGTVAVSLWERTVFMMTADHGEHMPRAKRNFTQNGYRSPLLIHDARLPAAPAVETRIENELTHAIDILPTVLAFGGHPIPFGNAKNLRPYLTATPPASPLRNVLCGHEVKGTKARSNRYARVRPGAVGRCAPASGTACSSDIDCAPDVCLLGTCGTGIQCMEDTDCGAGETCQHKAQKWCSFRHHPFNDTIDPPTEQPTVACATDADCVADCPDADWIYCTCESRELILYSLDKGEKKLIDLWVNPDEPGIAKKLVKFGPHPDEVPIGPGDPHEPLGTRLKCCMDQWWTPPPGKKGPLGDPSCTECEPQYACHSCGDGIVDSVEECDGAQLDGEDCLSQGFAGGGTLSCTPGCTFDTSGCIP